MEDSGQAAPIPESPGAADAPRGAPGRGAGVLARASFAAPLLGLALVGGVERAGGGGGAAGSFVLFTEGAAVLGIVCGIGALALGRGALAPAALRSAVLGTVLAVGTLLLAQIGALAGVVDRIHTTAVFDRAIAQATHEFAGWNGGAQVRGGTIFALEIDRRAEFAALALRPFKTPLSIVLLGVDNRNGEGPLAVDTSGARAIGRDGTVTVGLTREEALSRAAPDAAPSAVQPAVFFVARRGRRDGILALFPAGTSFERVVGLEIRVNGSPVRLFGRHFSLEDKRAIDRARATPR